MALIGYNGVCLRTHAPDAEQNNNHEHKPAHLYENQAAEQVL
jgi:hypothetical protein